MPSYYSICFFKKLVEVLHGQRDASNWAGAVTLEGLIEGGSDICHFCVYNKYNYGSTLTLALLYHATKESHLQ